MGMAGSDGFRGVFVFDMASARPDFNIFNVV